MAPERSALKTLKLLSILEKLGFQRASKRGSHLKLRNIGSIQRCVIVPIHDEIPHGTLRSILRQAGIEKEEFLRMLRDEK